jgi:VWFA-related protein
MMRTLAALSIVLLAHAAQQAPPTFRAGADAVQIEVSVRDRSRPVLGLSATDFLVSDDGVSQRVAAVSYGVKPIDVTVVLDVSLSVTGQMLDRLRRAVRQLMTDRGPEDRLKLIMFNSRVLRVVDFTTDADVVDRAIREASAGGGSSILDAVSVAAVAATDPDRRHLVMIFTDGSDSSSVLTPEVVANVIERTTSAVSAVVTLRNFATVSNAPGSGTALLQLLARSTGGVYLPILSASQDLTAAFKQAPTSCTSFPLAWPRAASIR